ncbi:hypothetical protein KC316_g508 [Hortaea werneckii]|nr:hypothetical protein KC324_g592 [Hortaea werneckii]KAI7595485.1 hypothetical protein KC316_g508 [Hortaea werneckii]
MVTPVLSQGLTEAHGVFPGVGHGEVWYDWYTQEAVDAKPARSMFAAVRSYHSRKPCTRLRSPATVLGRWSATPIDEEMGDSGLRFVAGTGAVTASLNKKLYSRINLQATDFRA